MTSEATAKASGMRHVYDGGMSVCLVPYGADKPLTLKYRNRTPDVHLPFDLNRLFANSRQAQAAERILLDGVLESFGRERSISVSLNRNHYTGRQCFDGRLYTYRIIVPTVNTLARKGLIDLTKAENNGPSGKQSTFRLSEGFKDITRNPPIIGYDPIQTIRLKDAEKKRKNYRPTAQTEKMQKEIATHNEALGDTIIGIEDFSGLEKRGQYLIINSGKGAPQYINMAQDRLYRVFNNETFSDGGRVYGVNSPVFSRHPGVSVFAVFRTRWVTASHC